MNCNLFEIDSVSGIHLNMPDADVSLYQALYSTTNAIEAKPIALASRVDAREDVGKRLNN